MQEKFNFEKIYYSKDDHEGAETLKNPEIDQIAEETKSLTETVMAFIDEIPAKYQEIIKYLLTNSNKDKWLNSAEISEGIGKSRPTVATQLNELMIVLRKAGKGIKLYKKRIGNNNLFTLNRVNVRSLINQQDKAKKNVKKKKKEQPKHEETETPVKPIRVRRKSTKKILSKSEKRKSKVKIDFDYRPVKTSIGVLNDRENKEFISTSNKITKLIREIRVRNEGKFRKKDLSELRAAIPRGQNQRLNRIYAGLRRLTYAIEEQYQTANPVIDPHIILIFKFFNKTL